MQIAQILGMASYEFRMHWRRRTLQVATLSLIGLNLVVLLVLGNSMEQYLAQFGTLDPNTPHNVVPFLWVTIYFVILVLFGPLMAEVIPLDHHLGVRELLDSLPLNRETYLAGKLLGMFLALLSGIAVSAIVLGTVAWLVFGGFEIAPYIQMWLVGVIPLVLLNPGLSLLLAAGQPTRRRAAAIGGGFAILSLSFFVASIRAVLDGNTNALLDSINPARPAILRYFMPAASNGATLSMLSSSASGDVVLAVVAGLAELLIAAAIIWYWQRWHENRV